MARKFLWGVLGLIALTIALGFAWAIAGQRMLQAAMVPSVQFSASAVAPAPDYARPDAWMARPGLADDPSRWAPAGYAPAPRPAAAAFHVSGTSYLGRDRWNAPLDDAGANARQRDYLRAQGSLFNGAAQVWSPRYRQATFGAFLAQDDPRSRAALDFAYADVLRAFDAFVAAQPADRPLIVVGHSQGALHLLRLLRERVAGRPLAQRIVAAYAVGWPISVSADLPVLGLPACRAATQTGCLLAWQSFARDGDPGPMLAAYETQMGYNDTTRQGTPTLCTNPLTGGASAAAPAAANIGALVGDALAPRGVGAACDARGILRLSAARPDAELPNVGPAVLPGGNYHVYDLHLFWANLRADAEARLNAWGGAHATGPIAAGAD